MTTARLIAGSGRFEGLEGLIAQMPWPDWTPPQKMIARQPYLPRWAAGGEGNPLGARAIYLGSTAYRIHGTNMPETIGQKVSSGCIRMLNEDVIDLYSRVDIGTKIVVASKRCHDGHSHAGTGRFAPGRWSTPSQHLLRVTKPTWFDLLADATPDRWTI